MEESEKMMEVISARDASLPRDEKTIYKVRTDNGDVFDVVRKHFPDWDMTKPIAYVVGHQDRGLCHEVLQYLRETCRDFGTYVLETRHRSSHRTNRDTCFGPEQAEYLAKQQMKTAGQMAVVRILCDGKVVKDCLA